MSTVAPYVYRPAPRVGVIFGVALLCLIALPNALVPMSRLLTPGGLAAVVFPLALAAPLALMLRNRVVLAPVDEGRALRLTYHMWLGAPREVTLRFDEIADAEVESQSGGGLMRSRVALVLRNGERVHLTESYSGGGAHEAAVKALRGWLQDPSRRATPVTAT